MVSETWRTACKMLEENQMQLSGLVMIILQQQMKGITNMKRLVKQSVVVVVDGQSLIKMVRLYTSQVHHMKEHLHQQVTGQKIVQRKKVLSQNQLRSQYMVIHVIFS